MFDRLWIDDYPNLQQLLQFKLAVNLPANITDIMVDMMDLDSRNNWRKLAMKMWPEFTQIDIMRKLKKQMNSVLELWGQQAGTTMELLDLLQQIQRIDVLTEMDEYVRLDRI
jgi:hypothetical protein